MGSKKPTFSHIVKTQLHQTPYLNFTISFFNIFLLFYFYLFIFFTTPKIPSFSIFSSLFLSSRVYPLFFFFLSFFPPPPTYTTSLFFSFFSHHPRTPFPFVFSFLFYFSCTSPLICFFFPFLLLLHKSSPFFFLSFFYFSFTSRLHKSSLGETHWISKHSWGHRSTDKRECHRSRWVFIFFYFFFLFCKLYCLVPEKILTGKLNSAKP